MANNIGGINGYGYGIGGYVPQRHNEETQTQAQQEEQVRNYEETQVDPSKVMDFLAQNNYFIDVTNTPAVEGVETDPTIANRVAGYMENFEVIYGIVENEFGAEKAPVVMDAVMDRLMGMV